MSEYIVDYELIPLKWRDGYGLSDIDLTDEIVRCLACRNFTNDSEHGAWCNWFMRSLRDDYDGYCAWAERKEGGE